MVVILYMLQNLGVVEEEEKEVQDIKEYFLQMYLEVLHHQLLLQVIMMLVQIMV
jgi:hypothetical protein